MAATELQLPQDSLESTPALDRTQSQAAKQLKVRQVREHLAGQDQPVRDLLAATQALEESESDGSAATLQEIIRQQKAARNIGEDLLEDMLKLDSLAGLHLEDRQDRKRALAQLEELVDQVDAVKLKLRKRRQEVEALAASEESTEQSPSDEPRAESETRQEEEHEPEDEEESAEEDQELEDEESSWSGRRPQEEQEEEEDPWNDLRSRLKLKSRELPQAYVVTADTPGLAAQDLNLELEGDLLRIKGLVRPTVQDAAVLRRWLRREPRIEDFAAHGFGRFQEAVRVPGDVDVNGIQASCRHGQLQVVLPRRQPRFPRNCRTSHLRPSMFPAW
mmetsp:Transcript_29903/g.53110  ORF Transcript_29903/g.53110 Transcript_29903/m.53110 type:complete len:333 (+) Transcript_29903:84-1082(+)